VADSYQSSKQTAINDNSLVGNTGITAAMVAASGLTTMSMSSLDGFNQASLDTTAQHNFQSFATQLAGRGDLDAGIANISFGGQPGGALDAVNLSGSAVSFEDLGFRGGTLDARSFGGGEPAFVPNYAAGEAAIANFPAFAANVPTVSMVSAEALMAAGGGLEGVQQAKSVGHVVADALGFGGAPTVDGLLQGLPGGGGLGELAAIAHVASPAIGDVPGWDMNMSGPFGAGFDMVFKVDAAMLHHDAVQPVLNG
jgi:hypothetical protein